MTLPLFNKERLQLHRERAVHDLLKDDGLISEVATHLLARLHDIRQTFPCLLTLGYFGQRVTMPLPWVPQRVVSDIFFHHPALWEHHTRQFGSLCTRICLDDEALPFGNHSFDGIISFSHLHWVQNLPATLRHIRDILKPGGLFLSTLWGGETLGELREALIETEIALSGGAAMRVSPMVTPLDAALLLQKGGFKDPVVDTISFTLTYASVKNLIKDLRMMGETNCLTVHQPPQNGKRFFATLEKIYREKFALPTGEIPATFQAIFLTGWGPHS